MDLPCIDLLAPFLKEDILVTTTSCTNKFYRFIMHLVKKVISASVYLYSVCTCLTEDLGIIAENKTQEMK